MKTVVCFGDSNTFGYKPDGTGRYTKDVRWTGVLAKELGDDYEVLEEGLNGRTTMWDDALKGFIKEEKNGFKYLVPFLRSHLPFEVITIMLGTNDLKQQFGLTAFDISKGIEKLVLTIQEMCQEVGEPIPKILIMCPPPLANYIPNQDWISTFKGGYEKSLALDCYYSEIAKTYRCSYLNLGELIETSKMDAIHIDEKDQRTIAIAVAEKIKKLFEEHEEE